MTTRFTTPVETPDLDRPVEIADEREDQWHDQAVDRERELYEVLTQTPAGTENSRQHQTREQVQSDNCQPAGDNLK